MCVCARVENSLYQSVSCVSVRGVGVYPESGSAQLSGEPRHLWDLQLQDLQEPQVQALHTRTTHTHAHMYHTHAHISSPSMGSSAPGSAGTSGTGPAHTHHTHTRTHVPHTRTHTHTHTHTHNAHLKDVLPSGFNSTETRNLFCTF